MSDQQDIEQPVKSVDAQRLAGIDFAHLELLAEMTHGFAASLDIDQTLRTALQQTMRYLEAEGGSVFLLVDDGKTLECRAAVGPVNITGMRLKSDQGIVGQAVQKNETLMIRDVGQSHNFNVAVDENTGFLTHSVLCAPLSVRGERLGALELVNKQGNDGLFDEGDRSFLTALASAAALAMLNARMAADLVEQEKVRKELEMAREIQRSLLPPDPEPRAPVHGLNIPARGVSGDLYLFFPMPDGRIFFALGDVSGKGIHAALFMAKTASLIRALAKLEHRLPQLFTRLNAEILETSSRGMFVTLAAGLYDPASDTVRLTNAGHEPPLYRSPAGEYTDYPASAPPLGILPELNVSEVEIPLRGGALYLFTDGLTEGFVSDGNSLGVEGIKQAIEGHLELVPQSRLQALVEPLTQGERSLRDDITLLVIEKAPPGLVASIQIPTLPERLKELRDVVRTALQGEGLPSETVEQMVLAVGEAAMNVVQHGFAGGEAGGRITLEIINNGEELVFRMLDNAPAIDPDRVRPRELAALRPGGLGSHFIRELMDSVEFLPPPTGSGNLLEMRKRIEQL